MKKFKNWLKIGLLGFCVPFMVAFSGCSFGGNEETAIYIVSLEKTETPDGVVFDITYSDGSSEFFTIEKASKSLIIRNMLTYPKNIFSGTIPFLLLS